ncbi:MAG: tetratricopeptide repeat protein [Candidatus Riflebacteria bacterium]|nr:tetratricopeptide repeat protein [Candidatus Riflebacteria bacterium]
MNLREAVGTAVRLGEVARLERLVNENARAVRYLLALTYQDDPAVRATASRGIGLAARQHPKVIEEVIRRLVWAMNDESGTNAETAPEVLSAIALERPDLLVPVVPDLMRLSGDAGLRGGLVACVRLVARRCPDEVTAGCQEFLRRADDEPGACAPGTRRLEKLVEAVEKNPNSARAHLKLGMALLQVGSKKNAEQELRRAVELDPGLAEAWVNLGGVLFLGWDFRGCVEANSKAVACNPSLLQAHYNLGLGYLYLGQADKVVSCFREVLDLDPKNAGGHYHLAVGLLATGEVEQARAMLSRAIALGYSPQPEFLKIMESHGSGTVPTIEVG